MGKGWRYTLSSERLIIALGRLAEKDGAAGEKAKSLIDWHYEFDGLTRKQTVYAERLIIRGKQKDKVKRKKKYYLYAIGDKMRVKLGYSSNINRRIKNLQTASAKKLECKWRFFCGDDEENAREMEKKLHRSCDAHHVRGEWFRWTCMERVYGFKAPRKNRCP